MTSAPFFAIKLRGLEPMGPGEAAMRCAGDGGQHHYFHAR